MESPVSEQGAFVRGIGRHLFTVLVFAVVNKVLDEASYVRGAFLFLEGGRLQS